MDDRLNTEVGRRVSDSLDAKVARDKLIEGG